MVQPSYSFSTSTPFCNSNNDMKNGGNEPQKLGKHHKHTNPKSRLNLPPSFQSSRPLPKNSLSDSEREQIQTGGSGSKEDGESTGKSSSSPQPITYKAPWWVPLLKLSVVFVPFLVVSVGYIAYETYNNRAVFFPFWVNSSVPLDQADGFENVDIDMLKEISKATLERRLNINHEIREYFGLPITLGDYETFDVRIEYNRLSVEGVEIDFRKSWLNPTVKFREIETPTLPTNINKYIQPLKARVGGGVDEDPEQDSVFIKQVDYKIKIRATIKVVNEVLHRIEPGSGRITFDAEVELDHTRLIKIVGALMHFKNKNGSGSGGTLERLW